MSPGIRIAAFLIIAVLIGWLVGSLLSGDSDTAPTTAGESSGVYRDVRGQIVRLAPDDGVMTVDHEEIEGFMPAMVMDLHLADVRELAPFSPGDEIIFDLAHIDGTFQAIRLRPADYDEAQRNEDDSHQPHENPLGRGDLVPDIELYDTAGDRFRLREMQPQHKVITFFFVRCPLVEFCPTQSQRLAQLQQHTAQSENGVHLVSLSLDAEHDDPSILADYASRFGANPDLWTLAGSDDPEAVREFADRAGGRISRAEAGGPVDHALIGLRVDGDRIVDLVYGLEAIESLILAL